ncbi:hypothetical protein, partial [Aquabacterium sp.]|uniref:hypothetical protein n=1 Tax=Aquabacterium sp. TaxID=1872578 RepID=UPI0025C10901
MSDTTPPTPVDDSSVLSGALPVVATFQPEPMQAPFGQAPESLLGKRLALARAHYGLNIEALSRLTKL